MPTVLLVDDEPSIHRAFRRAFAERGLTLRSAHTAAEAMAAIAHETPDTVVLDIHLPDATEFETLNAIRAVDARIPVIVITGHGTTDLAIEAMKAGAFDVLLKPLELDEVRTRIDQAVRSSRLMRVPAAMPEDAAEGDPLLGRCPAMLEVYKAIGRVAPQDVTVLITGESGTGKELVARAVYQHSKRAAKPFVAINCGAIPETLIESELFGHERGAFSGAERKRIGKFEQAHGGTIFLDEVGELSPRAQVKMLRILQERSFERVGGNETLHADLRILAATNDDLEKSVEQGRFRKDLYFRLNVASILLPPLRARGEDLNLLIDHYFQRAILELDRPGAILASETRERLVAHPWPGNIRELQSALKQAVLTMRGRVLTPDDLPAATAGAASVPTPAHWDAFVDERIAASSDDIYAECLAQMERAVLVRVLQTTGGNQLRAARLLGITRGSLRTKIRALGIAISREVWSGSDQSDS